MRIHSRPPRLPSCRLRRARIASVTGAPGTSSSGMTMASTMCASMCELKRYFW